MSLDWENEFNNMLDCFQKEQRKRKEAEAELKTLRDRVEGVSEDKILEALVQSYCTKENENKVMDPVLVNTMLKAIQDLYKSKLKG